MLFEHPVRTTAAAAARRASARGLPRRPTSMHRVHTRTGPRGRVVRPVPRWPRSAGTAAACDHSGGDGCDHGNHANHDQAEPRW